MKKKEKSAAPRRRLSSESHELQPSDAAAIHKSDLSLDSYGAPDDLLSSASDNEGAEAEQIGMGEGTLPPPPAPASQQSDDRVPPRPRLDKVNAPPSRPTASAPQSAPSAPAAAPKSASATKSGKSAAVVAAAPSNDVVLRAAAGQDAAGFWTLDAAVALTGIKAKDPSGAANSALFGTALVIEWLAAKHFEQEPEWKLLVQKGKLFLFFVHLA